MYNTGFNVQYQAILCNFKPCFNIFNVTYPVVSLNFKFYNNVSLLPKFL